MAPARAARQGRLCRNSRLGGTSGKVGQPNVLALRYESGGLFAEISLGPLQALILSLRIADGLGQHLA